MSNKDNDQGQSDLLTVVKSVMAAAIGVQSNKNRENDFKTTSIMPYVIGGIVFTVVFIVTLVVIVNIILGTQ